MVVVPQTLRWPTGGSTGCRVEGACLVQPGLERLVWHVPPIILLEAGVLLGLFERLAMRLGGQSRVFQLLFTDDLKMVGQAASADNYHGLLEICGLLHRLIGYCKFEVELSERRTDCAVGGRSPAERGAGAHRSFSVLAWMKPLQRDGPHLS